ncbi:Glycosyltransferase involved in cell wall bisynthesis [Paenibacillus sp. 1_12]|uniref:tetratricopeptide repeat-containing glycosyltransferase family 2 protein n=1 Tax=Paenibacillus sp. 1_12 TaxID=1566278 RepID=UPI0008F325A2|nr:glycosyltransferase family 2 protein [Paenibacillus sp. 1_12]SFL58251.1 Glycosyltransferase involved in cell wall bisynthesis [Paenibacillus sp. 1_12]
MITISLCMIVKNEKDTLERCIQSVKNAVDEIIIVDTGSTDHTKEIAMNWTSHVIDFEWNHNFSAARNRSFTEATMDYILWLDADDVLLAEDLNKLLHLKESLSPVVDAISMPYHCDFDEYGNITLNVRRVRLVKRLKNYRWFGEVHEDLSIGDASYLDSDIVITHMKNHDISEPDRNLRIYKHLLSSGKDFTPRDILHYAMELHRHRLYDEAVPYYLKVMEIENLTTEDKIHVCMKLADCYYYLGNRVKEREFTFKTFEYDTPRPELCCRLAYYFYENKQFPQAVYWYKLAIDSPLPRNPWATTNHVSRTWLPHMQLGHCYYELGEYELSYHHNKSALEFVPNNRGIINNIHLLAKLITRKKSN